MFLTFFAAPALHTAIDTPRMALAPSFAKQKNYTKRITIVLKMGVILDREMHTSSKQGGCTISDSAQFV